MPERIKAFRDARAGNDLGLMLNLLALHGGHLAEDLTLFDVAGVIEEAELSGNYLEDFREAVYRLYGY